MRASPEARFVILCVREPTAPCAVRLEAAADAVRDWDELYRAATRNGVAAFVYHAIVTHRIQAPANVTIALRYATHAALARVVALTPALATVVSALQAAHIPAIVLKGPVLARTLYGNPVLRPYCDIDLTVQDRHESAVAAILRNLGFTESPLAGWYDQHGTMHAGVALHRNFFRDNNETALELHSEPLQLGLPPVCETERWQRALAVPGLPGALMLCPEDQLVQLSVHVHKHGFSRLIWLKDLDLLLRAREPVLDWDLVQYVAQQEGVEASLWYSISLTALLLKTPLPEGLLAALQPALPLRMLYRAVWPVTRIAALRGYTRRRAVQLLPTASFASMIPSFVLMGRKHDRAQSALRTILSSLN